MARVFIGVGSNLHRLKSVRAGLKLLQAEFTNFSHSSLYESEAVGFKGGTFYNLVVAFDTDLSVSRLQLILKEIEKKLGRKDNAIKFSARKLDLDLLLYDNLVDVTINVPRAEITSNAFVLKPLKELAPLLVHPTLNKTYQQLWLEYPQQKQKLWILEVNLIQ
ncbi:2-amino-4-hydroxy-6-hydroxymethyldihydropteridine pyrophosphokinase [Psychromonas sp. CNPT3]|uniref:2-amino-4-hydroxy-6- hydroxymethyldihydropteridine diphosphokinase n=1 Tax=Psychromonas sp. CNPT3 TaxID=314282 RepID=UPI00006E5098|nr:2-amino-4-hydroxy-6-hydroxymethyldihydropteridine diphosphokinase [Psychromonas sp. CNPT3]AGH82461.1 2-amino-4-hydroxy-6-hydroxymethyldihydropteridine pyrophosphokinase [Psychromonas sp. CNPT3]